MPAFFAIPFFLTETLVWTLEFCSLRLEPPSDLPPSQAFFPPDEVPCNLFVITVNLCHLFIFITAD